MLIFIHTALLAQGGLPPYPNPRLDTRAPSLGNLQKPFPQPFKALSFGASRPKSLTPETLRHKSPDDGDVDDKSGYTPSYK